MHPATIGLQNREMIILLLFQQEEKSFTETGRLLLFWKAHRIFNIDEGSWDPCGCCASAYGAKIHPHVWNRWMINIRVKSKAKYGLFWQDRCTSSEIRVVAHAYWKSGAVLDVLDHIAQQGRCDFVPDVTLKIKWKYTCLEYTRWRRRSSNHAIKKAGAWFFSRNHIFL